VGRCPFGNGRFLAHLLRQGERNLQGFKSLLRDAQHWLESDVVSEKAVDKSQKAVDKLTR